MIFLADDDLKSTPLAWTTNKVKHVVTSTLAAEALSLHDCVNHAIYLPSMVAEAIQVRPTDLPIIAYTDSNNMSKAIKSTTLISDQRLRIDIGAIKQKVEEDNVTVRWIPKGEMLADSLTKKGASVQSLMDALTAGELENHEVQ